MFQGAPERAPRNPKEAKREPKSYPREPKSLPKGARERPKEHQKREKYIFMISTPLCSGMYAFSMILMVFWYRGASGSILGGIGRQLASILGGLGCWLLAAAA